MARRSCLLVFVACAHGAHATRPPSAHDAALAEIDDRAAFTRLDPQLDPQLDRLTGSVARLGNRVEL